MARSHLRRRRLTTAKLRLHVWPNKWRERASCQSFIIKETDISNRVKISAQELQYRTCRQANEEVGSWKHVRKSISMFWLKLWSFNWQVNVNWTEETKIETTRERELNEIHPAVVFSSFWLFILFLKGNVAVYVLVNSWDHWQAAAKWAEKIETWTEIRREIQLKSFTRIHPAVVLSFLLFYWLRMESGATDNFTRASLPITSLPPPAELSSVTSDQISLQKSGWLIYFLT